MGFLSEHSFNIDIFIVYACGYIDCLLNEACIEVALMVNVSIVFNALYSDYQGEGSE